MRNFWHWLRYNLRYFGHPGWDTGISPPELIAFIQNHPAGHALDLGCGTGTNLIALARAGWQVTGVDFALKATAQARHRLNQAGVQAHILQRDVLNLDDLKTPFDLILDIGCYHGLSDGQKYWYESNLKRLLNPAGHVLIYGFRKDFEDAIGISEADLHRLASQMKLISQQAGSDRTRHSLWLLYQTPQPLPD